MKTNVELYKPKDGEQKLSPVFTALQKYELQRTVDDMVLYGIGRIASNYVNLGLKSWSDVAFKALPIVPPADLLKARNFILRHLSERLIMFGVLSVTISPSEQELQAMQARWRGLSGEAQEKPGIALNIELDPVSKEAMAQPTGTTATP